MKIIRNAKSLIAALMLSAACFPQIVWGAIDLELVVNTSSPTPALEVVANSSPCPSNPDLSCIAVPRFSTPNIRFNLEDACQANGPDYKFDSIRITLVEKVWPTAADPLPSTVADDFFADRNTGVIDLVGGNGGKNKLTDDRIKFKNKNSNQYTVFYEITAKECAGPGTITLDPSIVNTGK